MKKYFSLLLIISVSAISFGQSDKNELVPFKLKYKNKSLATIQVPAGYKEETKSYVEGVHATLTYPDGAYIVLQIGGIKLPLFSESEHEVSKRQDLRKRIIRSGRVRNTELFWREEDSYGVWPPTNIGFTNVPKNRLKLFEKSLGSFVRANR